MTSDSILFSDLGLPEPLLKAVEEVGYEAPTSIQAEAIPPLLEGNDLLGQAQTGTGKTAAFVLPLLARLDLEQRAPQILVLTPTRELALQVAEAMQTYARFLKGFHVVPVYGGQSIETQLRQLKRGVHAVVGTPGRIQDHLRRATLKLESLSALVLDEADEMLRMGFLEDVEQILAHTPAEKQVALFSATLPGPIRKVAKKYLRQPVEIEIRGQAATVSTVSQHYWRVTGVNKLHALTRILEVESFDAMIVFVRTKVATAELAEKLEARGFSSAPLNGDMSQALRERTIDRLKSGRIDIVVATDVAARGLDVDRISHVVNFDMPYDIQSYVHRIGRTARAGREGKAILFVSPREKSMLFSIQRVTGQTIEKMHLPSREDVANQRVAQFEQSITDTLEAQELEYFEELVERYCQENEAEPLAVASELAFLAQRDRPLAQGTAAPEPRDERPAREERKPSHDDSRPPREERRPPREERRPPREERRPPREERRPPREGFRPPHEDRRPPRRPGDVSYSMERYRIEVGRMHGVQPGNIVGAIANEAGLEGNLIGKIEIFDSWSLVDLPEGMPRDLFEHLQEVRVRNQPLRIRRYDGAPPHSTRRDGGPPGGTRRGAPPRRPQRGEGSSPRGPGDGSGPRRRSSRPSDDGPGARRKPRYPKGPGGKKPRHKKLGKKQLAKRHRRKEDLDSRRGDRSSDD